jgi:hypothetical protein
LQKTEGRRKREEGTRKMEDGRREREDFSRLPLSLSPVSPLFPSPSPSAPCSLTGNSSRKVVTCRQFGKKILDRDLNAALTLGNEAFETAARLAV